MGHALVASACECRKGEGGAHIFINNFCFIDGVANCCAIFLMCMSGNCVAFQLSLRGVETESFCDEAIHWKFRKVMQIATPFQGSQ